MPPRDLGRRVVLDVIWRSVGKAHRVGLVFFFFFSSRRRHTRSLRDWSSDVCSSDLASVSGPAFLDLIVPSADGKTLVRATAPFTATAGQAIHVHVAGGVATSSESEIGRASCRERV